MKVRLFHLFLGMGMTRLVDAFVVRSSSKNGRTRPSRTTKTTPIRHPSMMMVAYLTEVDTAAVSQSIQWLSLTSSDATEARTAFYIWFFGASGAAGVARSAFPRMYQNMQEIQSYRTIPTTTTGGINGNTTSDDDDDEKSKDRQTKEDMVGLSIWCGYPRDLAVADVQAILNNPLSIEQMVEKYPVDENLWSQKGYITYQAFRQANAQFDPLAVRAVFDCFSQSTQVSNPDIAQAKLNRYKESLDSMKQDLVYSKMVGWSAIATLLGLLGLADIEAFQYAYAGWFPDWPGGRLWLQGGLWDPDIGIWSIPKYWI